MKKSIKALKKVRSFFDDGRDIARELGDSGEYLTWDERYIQVDVVKYLLSREIVRLKEK